MGDQSGDRSGGAAQAHVLGKRLAEPDVVALFQEQARRPRIPLAVSGGESLVSVWPQGIRVRVFQVTGVRV